MVCAAIMYATRYFCLFVIFAKAWTGDFRIGLALPKGLKGAKFLASKKSPPPKKENSRHEKSQTRRKITSWNQHDDHNHTYGTHTLVPWCPGKETSRAAEQSTTNQPTGRNICNQGQMHDKHRHLESRLVSRRFSFRDRIYSLTHFVTLVFPDSSPLFQRGPIVGPLAKLRACV